MRRTLVATCLATLLVACATSPEPASGDRAAVSRTAQPLVPVAIELELPSGWEIVERYHYDSVQMGSKLRIGLEEWPWVRLDLFAYGVGVDSDLEQGLRQIVTDHRAEMDYVVEQGTYQGWKAEDESHFTIESHPSLARGTRLSMRLQQDGGEEGSTSYLFYRPPFALKVRASFPGFANELTEQAIDAAVRELIPAVKVTAPIACQNRGIEIAVPAAFDATNEADRKRDFLLGLASATLHHALHGCTDLTAALSMASSMCEEYEMLCGNPPWTLEEGE